MRFSSRSASSCPDRRGVQVGMAIGLSRSGYGGALAAWTAFTLPSALVFVLVAYGVSATGAVAANA